MSNDPQFRLAAESDTETLLEFMQAYYAFDGHSFDREKAGAVLTGLLRDASLGRVWLILDMNRLDMDRPDMDRPDMDRPDMDRLDGGTAVGYVVLCFGYSLEWLGRDAFVDEFYLREEYRGRGWGRATMAFVEEAARAAGIRTLHLEAMRENEAALKIYGKMGFHACASTLMSKWIARDAVKPQGRDGH
jgi:ribosomal protein S18 acetylase RimI-like enzyme